MSECLACDFEWDKSFAKAILEDFKLCKKHQQEINEYSEAHMQCSVCGSQDTTRKTGISQKTGKPWVAYDCNEAQCKNEKGYPSRTFGFAPKVAVGASNSKKEAYVGQVSNPISTLEAKVDKILAILKANFKDVSVQKDETPF